MGREAYPLEPDEGSLPPPVHMSPTSAHVLPAAMLSLRPGEKATQSLRLDQSLMSPGLQVDPEVQERFEEMKERLDRTPPSKAVPDRPVSEVFNRHPVKANTFKEARDDLYKDFNEMEDFLDFQTRRDMRQGLEVSEAILKYKYGECSKQEAIVEITKKSTVDDRDIQLADLHRTQPIRET